MVSNAEEHIKVPETPDLRVPPADPLPPLSASPPSATTKSGGQVIDTHGWEAGAIAAAVSDGEVSCHEVVETSLRRIEEDSHLRCFITVTAERARQRARALDTGDTPTVQEAPLLGVPFAVKDMIAVEGVPLTGGSPSRDECISPQDARVVSVLEQAGAVLVGTTNLHEWAFGATSENPHFGAVRNPLDEERMAGGSSGGSAAAVAAGIVPVALGTDAGGSVRIPASYCGVAGLRPTIGAVSTAGCHPQSWTFDTVGPLTSTAADLQLVAEVLLATGRWPVRRWDLSVDQLRVGVPSADWWGVLDERVARALEDAVSHLESQGTVVVRDLPLPDRGEVARAFFAVVLPETAAVHGQSRRAARAAYGADVRELLQWGDHVPAVDYIAGLRFRDVVHRVVSEAFGQVDVILTPTTPNRAPPLGTREITWPDGGRESLLDAAPRYSLLASLVGLPAASFPVRCVGGLPAGVQAFSSAGDDATVLALGTVLADLAP